MTALIIVFLVVVVLQFAVALGVADYAAAKGYSYAGFFCYAAAFLPFAIMTAVLAPAKAGARSAMAPGTATATSPAPSWAGSRADSDTETCAHCEQDILKSNMASHLRAQHGISEG